MIKRNIPKKLIPVENLTEDVTLGTAGIDVTSPPAKLNTVYDMNNLDVALDGGLTLRKPIFFKSSVFNQNDGVVVGYLFDDSRIEISKTSNDTEYFMNLDNATDTVSATEYVNIDDPTDIISADSVVYVYNKVIYIDGYGDVDIVNDNDVVVDPADILISSVDDTNIINTNTSTIITGFKFNLNATTLKHYAKQYDLGKDFYKNRPVRITKDENGVYKAEVLRIETSTLYTDSDGVTKASFNLMDDYVYSFRDNYDSGYVYTDGILTYTPKSNSTSVTSSTVEELTESDKYLLVDSVTKEDADKTYILKAFVTNTVRDNPNYKIYCTWEKTYDNVTWLPVPEFLNRYGSNTILLNVVDASTSYENLTDSYKYTRTVQYTPFLDNDSSNQDTLGNRPDVLILNGVDSATYRFSIRSVAVTPSDLNNNFNSSASYYEVVSGVSVENGRNYITLNSSTRLATLRVKFHFEFFTNVSSSTGNIHLTARSVYEPDTSTTSYDYESSFVGLDADTLDDLFTDNPIVWSTEDNVTKGNVIVDIPIELAVNWITQLLCLKFYLYESSGDDPVILWGDDVSFKAVAGYDISHTTPTSNPTFNYLLDSFTYTGTCSAKIISGDSNHPDCFTVATPTRTENGKDFPIDWMEYYSPDYQYRKMFRYVDDVLYSSNMEYHNRGAGNSIPLNLQLRIDEVEVKSELPMEMLDNLTHSTDSIYTFDTYAYYFKNITLSCSVLVNSIVCDDNRMDSDFNYHFADLTAILSNVKIPLYDYLNLNNNLSPLASAMHLVFDNIEISEDNAGPLTFKVDYTCGGTKTSSEAASAKAIFERGTGYTSTSDYVKREFGLPRNNYTNMGVIISKVLTTYPILAAFTEFLVSEFINRLDRLEVTTADITKFTLSLPTNPFGVTVNVLDDDTTVNLSSVINAFKYNQFNKAWEYGTETNAVLISATALEGIEKTPESDTRLATISEIFSGKGAYVNNHTYKPFTYMYKRDNVNQKNMFVRIDNADILNTYDLLKVEGSPYVYNMDYDVLDEEKYASLDDISSYLANRYSLELANTTKNVLFTKSKQVTDYANIDIYDSNKIYYNYRIWHYGKNLKNNIYFSEGDSITTPIDNCLTLSTDTEDYVTALIPWRDYLIATTTKNIYLISKANDSYVFKQINTFIGVPNADAKTCKAILNGVIFKSGKQIYVIRPNTYSSDETILNITDISKPIAHLLIDGVNNFAIATEYYYYVFIPRTSDTLVFKYEYTRKIWSKFTYPLVLQAAKVFDVNNIIVRDNANNIYYFDKSIDWYRNALNVDSLEYGDYLNNNQVVTPISFTLDTGQKSSNIQYFKQFTESKFIIATTDVKDTFPVGVTIYVDGINLIASHKYSAGNLQVITTDPNTDGAFQKTSPEDIGYLNTNIVSDSSETFNVIRQMILRYMGKGKTLRHVLDGKSTFNFKIYMLYYRYRMPHNKQ